MMFGAVARALVFFALAIGSLLVPVAVLWFIVGNAPFPYTRSGPDLLDRPFDNEALANLYFPNTKTATIALMGGAKVVAGVGAHFDAGADARIAAFDDAYMATLALEGLLEEPGATITERTRGGKYTRARGTYKDGSPLELFAWAEDRWLFEVRGRSREHLEATIDRLSYLHRKKDDSFVEKLLGDMFPILVLCFVGWLVIVVPTWARAASWAAVVPPKNSASVDRAELERRLRAMASDQGPFFASFAGREATVEWRATESPWKEQLAETDVDVIERVRLHLDEEDRTVRVIDEEAMVDWAPPMEDGTRTPPKLEWSVERAIFFFERRRNLPLGMIIEDGYPRFDPQYRYEFVSAEMKEPLIALVTQAGWTYRPVFSFRSRAFFG